MSASYAETAAEIAAAQDPADELRELIEESDRLLWVLEEMNREGRTRMGPATARSVADLTYRVWGVELTSLCWETQVALDHIFEHVQPRLFERHLKALGYEDIDDEPDEEPES